MAGEWRIANLADVCDRVSVGYVGPTSEYFCESSEGVRMLRSQNVRPGRMELNDVKYVRTEFHNKNKKSQLKAGDILFVRVGQNRGDCCIVPKGVGELNCANIVFARPLSVLGPFLGFYFRSVIGQQQLRSISTGSAQGVLNTGAIASLKVPVPSDDEAQAIAAVLGALDDKIELNRRMNATLEAMARALFQSWFVDFDPVRAKLDGRQPVGMDAETAAQFPDGFEDSPHGSVPRGWEYRTFGDIADINWGDTDTTKASYVENGFTAYSASGADGFLPGFDFDRTGVVVSAIGANAGVTWLAHGKWSCIKNTLRFWATASELSTEFLFYSTDGREKWPQRGSAQPFISQGDARAMQILVPTNSLANRFGGCVQPWLAKLKCNEIQSRTLATLRDTLLPKLLSGELTVAECEKAVPK